MGITPLLWKTLTGARFTDPKNRVVKVEVRGGVARVTYKDGDVESVHLTDYDVPEGIYVDYNRRLSVLRELRTYAEKIAAALGQRAGELEDAGREEVAAVLRAVIDLDLFMLLGWIYGEERQWRVVGRPVLRAGSVELQFPLEVDIDSYVCWFNAQPCKLMRVLRLDLRREIRNVWLTVATRYWKYALDWSNEVASLI